MRRVLLLLPVLLTALVVPMPSAFACSCAQMSAWQAMVAADAVFTGTVVDVDDPEGGGAVISSGREVRFTIDVDAVQKGDVTDPAVVTSAAGGASCGAGFALGGRYRVMATDEDGSLSTSLCSGNEELAGPAAPPAAEEAPPPDGQGWAVPVATATVAVVAIAGVALAGRRRRPGI